MSKPVVIDLFCGLGGWSKGFLAEGWDAIGFDIERHSYGGKCYPAQLVLQDVLTLDGRQFRGRAQMIVASPPCQRYSYMAMPFSRGKKIAAHYRQHPELIESDLNALFNAAFRVAREAELPLVVENVKGAQPWVGRAKWHYGSYYLWGDVPALMPMTLKVKGWGGTWFYNAETGQGNPNRDRCADEALKRPGRNFHAHENGLGSSPSFNGGEHETRGVKGAEPVGSDVPDGTGKGSWFFDSRKAASAMIAEIPFDLASHIARVFKP